MYTILALPGDPTPWYISDDDATTVEQAVRAGGDPVTVPVLAPVRGILILSPTALAAVSVRPVRPEKDAVPSYTIGEGVRVYLPSPAGASAADSAYTPAAGTDPGQLVTDLRTALVDGTMIEVAIVDPISTGGTLLINGAVLSFAVVYTV